ncbi:MAG: aminotransferase class IV [Chloroflexota bacterium]
MGDVFYLDGAFVPAESAALPVTDLGLVRGYGVFDFTRTYNGQPWQLQAHVDRLYESARSIGLMLPWSTDEVTGIINETLAQNDHDESYIRVIVTGGDSLDSVTLDGHPRLLVMITRATPPADAIYRAGAHVVTVDEQRYMPGVKSIVYIPAVRAMQQARAAGGLEALYRDQAGYVYEGTTTNVFAVIDGRLVTPPLQGVLRGITRDVILKLAQSVLPVDERPLLLDALYQADEVFITSSTKQVMPVVRVDDCVISEAPGPYTRHLMRAFGDLTGCPLPVD